MKGMQKRKTHKRKRKWKTWLRFIETGSFKMPCSDSYLTPKMPRIFSQTQGSFSRTWELLSGSVILGGGGRVERFLCIPVKQEETASMNQQTGGFVKDSSVSTLPWEENTVSRRGTQATGPGRECPKVDIQHPDLSDGATQITNYPSPMGPDEQRWSLLDATCEPVRIRLYHQDG